MQTTLTKPFKIEGIGLHSGKTFSVDVLPAPADTGIRFRRTDVRHCDFTRITPYNVSSTQLATTIDCGGLPISTIEHLAGSFYGVGVDNAFVEVSGSEVPILDGSAAPIVALILEAGVSRLDKPRRILKVTRPVSVGLDGKTVEIVPYDGFSINFELDYAHPVVGRQIFDYTFDESSFVSEIAFARTFGFKREVDALWFMGLAKGGSLETAVVIDDCGVLNPGGLKAPDEFVRHKILDMFGDLSLIGYRLMGRITAVKSGHQVNNIFARALLEASNSYEIIESPGKSPIPGSEEQRAIA